MLSYHQALKIILNGVTPPAPKTLPLLHAMGHVAATSLTASENIPPFHNSAMDGFAVQSDRLRGATQDSPVILDVDGSSRAGDAPEKGAAGAWEIMTGAPVPAAYDAVIRIEDVTILGRNADQQPVQISVNVEGFPGKNIRKAGTDFAPGDPLMDQGVLLGPPQIMALATLGQAEISVTPSPSAAVISTGKELVDQLDQPLRPGQIRNSNGPYLLSSLKAFGLAAENAGTILDDPDDFDQKISHLLARNVDLIFSSGAVSMGRFDFVPDGIKRQGGEILFHKVAIRPGKPLLFARFPNGTTYFGLPGNPIAAAVGLRFFAYPLIRKLRGQAAEEPLQARLTNDFHKESSFRFFQKARYHHDDTGQLLVEVLSGQESYKISPLLRQNCWVVIPEDGLSVAAGTTVELYPLFPSPAGGLLS